MKLWLGQTISLLGTQITRLALPLTAVLVLHATPGEMSLLTALQFAPFLLFGLVAGVWIDRWKRRPILITTEIGRLVLLALVPIAAWWGLLRIEYLYVISFSIGLLTVFFDVAYQAFLPTLIDRDQLVEGNSKLTFSDAGARIVGTGLGGVLIQWLTAPIAILFDALSYLISAVLISCIRVQETTIVTDRSQRNLFQDMIEGLTFIWRERSLRTIAGAGSTLNIGESVVLTFFVLYLSQDRTIGPAALSFVVIAGSVGSLIGTLVSQKIVQRFGLTITLISALIAISAGRLLLPLAFGPQLLLLAMLFLSQLVSGIGGVVYNVAQISMRQAITPHQLQGRMTASLRFLMWGALSVGALLGGQIGELFGLQFTLILGSLGGLLASVWLIASPIQTPQDAS